MIELNGKYFSPAFTSQSYYVLKNNSGNDTIRIGQTDWKRVKSSFVIWALIPYSAAKSDMLNANFVSPGGEQKFIDSSGNIISMPARFRHWLGTSQRGNDLLAGLIEGTRIALLVGFISMFIAFLIGVTLGSLAGYFGDRSIQISYPELISGIILIPIAWFYAFTVRNLLLKNAFQNAAWQGWLQLLLSIFIFLFIISVGIFIVKRITASSKHRLYLPLDNMISRFTEIVIALPLLLIILSIAAVVNPSVWNVIIIIGLTSWTGIARLTRAEMLRIRSLPYIEAVKSLGFKNHYIMLKHALPNLLAPVLVSVAFGIANAILIESVLSFLGLGLTPKDVTWGLLLSDGTINIEAWWMIIFPGLLIFLTIAVLEFNWRRIAGAIGSEIQDV